MSIQAAQDIQEQSRPPLAEARHFTTQGYGPPRLLTPDQVTVAADALQRTTYDHLLHGVDPAELTRAEICPQI